MPSVTGRPYRLRDDGLNLIVRVTPNAGADRIEGRSVRDDGLVVLKLRVAAVPDKGKANAAVIALLAKALGLSKSVITISAGETARQKTLALRGNAAALAAAIDALG